MGRSAIRQDLGTASFYISTDYSLKMLDFENENVKSGLNFSEWQKRYSRGATICLTAPKGKDRNREACVAVACPAQSALCIQILSPVKA